MALYPCDVGGHRYYGAQQTIYPAFIEGATAYRRKLRLCPDHFACLLNVLEKRTLLAEDGELVEHDATCVLCGQAIEAAELAFFATVYPARAERRDYWGACHSVCAPKALAHWQIPPSMP